MDDCEKYVPSAEDYALVVEQDQQAEILKVFNDAGIYMKMNTNPHFAPNVAVNNPELGPCTETLFYMRRIRPIDELTAKQ